MDKWYICVNGYKWEIDSSIAAEAMKEDFLKRMEEAYADLIAKTDCDWKLKNDCRLR